MSDLCTDNRFELIEKYKQKLIDGTNIEMAPDEMAVIDNILFRFWQMGWLDKLDADAVPVVPCGECEFFKPDKETPASISWYGRCQKNNRQWKMAVADFCSNGWRKDDEHSD